MGNVGEMGVDVPVFVFVFAPNPPKVLVVLVLDWPKPPLPNPNDMMGDVSGMGWCLWRDGSGRAAGGKKSARHSRLYASKIKTQMG